MTGPSEPRRSRPDDVRQSNAEMDEIDIAWEEAEIEVPSRSRARDPIPTMHDEDPLKHDIGYRRDRDPTRESRPTLPVIDPLQYDLPDSERKA
jgi:hypothetical protein